MMSPEVEIYPQQAWGGSRFIQLHMLHRDRNGVYQMTTSGIAGPAPKVVTGFTTGEHTPGEYSDPSSIMTIDSAQRLVDTLFGLGIRPSAAAGSAGQLDAVQKHLDDMRAIVFNKLSVPEPTR